MNMADEQCKFEYRDFFILKVPSLSYELICFKMFENVAFLLIFCSFPIKIQFWNL